MRVFLDRLAVWWLDKRNLMPTMPWGMTLVGNAVATKQKDGSYLVWLMPGANHVTVLYGSQLIDPEQEKFVPSADHFEP
jgi:hypothetical protein